MATELVTQSTTPRILSGNTNRLNSPQVIEQHCEPQSFCAALLLHRRVRGERRGKYEFILSANLCVLRGEIEARQALE